MVLTLVAFFWLQVVFLHPVHNYALVAYDPSSLGPVGASVVRAAELLPGGFDFVDHIIISYTWNVNEFVRKLNMSVNMLLLFSLFSYLLQNREKCVI